MKSKVPIIVIALIAAGLLIQLISFDRDHSIPPVNDVTGICRHINFSEIKIAEICGH